MFTQRLGIHFSSCDVKNPCHFECPHRLSDKLLKSSCNAALSSPLRGGVYYAFLFQSQPVISGFFLFNRPGCLWSDSHPPCRWRRIIGSSQQAATAKCQKNDWLLHSTAKPRLIPFYTQTYPQWYEKVKMCERCANVFVKMLALNKDAPSGVLDEFFTGKFI